MPAWAFFVQMPDGWVDLLDTLTGTTAEAEARCGVLAYRHLAPVCADPIEETRNMTQGLTAIGEAALLAREGRRLKAYLDTAKPPVWTIGHGVTTIDEKPVTKGMTITDAECDALFARTLVRYAKTVDDAVKVPLADHERDALISVCYNIGIGTPNPRPDHPPGFLGSTFLKLLNAGDRQAAAKALLSYSKPASVVTRREAEMAQFLTAYTVALPRPISTQARIKVAVRPTGPVEVHPATTAPVIVPIVPKVVARQGWFSAWVDRVFAPTDLPDLAARG